MAPSNQYEIPYDSIPKGIELALNNSDRLRTDAEILAERKRYNSAIPLITLAVEEFGKTLWLSEYFGKNISVPDEEGFVIFNKHPQKIKKVLDYAENLVKQRTLSTRKDYREEDSFHIPEEFDEQKFKNRMWYVGYQKVENPESSVETRTWKKQPWKNPLYVEELAFGGGYNEEFGQLHDKYFDLWRCAYYGIQNFRNTSLYAKILKAMPPEEPSFDQIEHYLEKHFFLKDIISSMGSGHLAIDLHITPRHPLVTPNLVDIIKEHIKKKYRVKQVDITLADNDLF